MNHSFTIRHHLMRHNTVVCAVSRTTLCPPGGLERTGGTFMSWVGNCVYTDAQ